MSNTTKRYLDLSGLTTYDSEIKDYIYEHCIEGIQSDWDETDPSDPSYIKNKPIDHEIVSATEPTEQSVNDFWMKPFES